MRVERIPFAFPIEKPRTGVHLSDILKDLLRSRDPKRYSAGPVDDKTRANFSRGIAWEEMLKAHHLWPAHILLQQEFIADDIIHTLDGFDARNEVVYESKCTMISADRDIQDEKFIGWKWQLMSYVRVSRATHAVLDILHLAGDWKPPITWPPVRWKWEFEPRELDSNRTMILRHRDRMVREGKLPNA